MLEAAPQRAARLYRQCSAGPGHWGRWEGAAGQGRQGCSLGFPTQGLKPLAVSWTQTLMESASGPLQRQQHLPLRSLESQRPEPVVEFLNWHHLSLSLISQAPQPRGGCLRAASAAFEFSGASGITCVNKPSAYIVSLAKANAVTSVSSRGPWRTAALSVHTWP